MKTEFESDVFAFMKKHQEWKATVDEKLPGYNQL